MFIWKMPSIIQKDSMGSLEQKRTSTTTVSILANRYTSIPSGGAQNSFLLQSVTISFTLIRLFNVFFCQLYIHFPFCLRKGIAVFLPGQLLPPQ